MRWHPVPDFPDYYVDTDGAVLSRKRHEDRVLRAARDAEGRAIVTLVQGGRLVTRRVHVLMMATFVGPRPPNCVTRHLDGDPTNNALSNLMYGTYTENAIDSISHGTHFQSSKTHCANGHAYTAENTYSRPDRNGRICRICRKAASARYRPKQERRSPRPLVERFGECERLHPGTPARMSTKAGGRRHCLECHRRREQDRRNRKAGESVGMG